MTKNKGTLVRLSEADLKTIKCAMVKSGIGQTSRWMRHVLICAAEEIITGEKPLTPIVKYERPVKAVADAPVGCERCSLLEPFLMQKLTNGVTTATPYEDHRVYDSNGVAIGIRGNVGPDDSGLVNVGTHPDGYAYTDEAPEYGLSPLSKFIAATLDFGDPLAEETVFDGFSTRAEISKPKPAVRYTGVTWMRNGRKMWELERDNGAKFSTFDPPKK